MGESRLWEGKESIKPSAAAALVFSRLHPVTEGCAAASTPDNAADSADASEPGHLHRCESKILLFTIVKCALMSDADVCEVLPVSSIPAACVHAAAC